MYKNNVQNSSVNLSKQKSKDKMNTSSNTTKIKNDSHNNREMYMKGIDASYHYEGYTYFKTEDLDKKKSAL